MASSLRRTLVLPVLCSTIIIAVSCKNSAQKEKEKIRYDFDSINRLLKKIDTVLHPTNELYDSLFQAAWKDNETRQLYYTLLDFHGYMGSIKYRFCMAAGDSSGTEIPADKQNDIELTNHFFKEKIKHFSIAGILDDLRKHTRDTAIISKIDQFAANTKGNLVEKYFRDAPPVAVITMLNYFEQKIKEITFEVLREHFKTQ